jgi:hypothetical protein
MLVTLLGGAVVLAYLGHITPVPSGRWLPWAVGAGFVVLAWLFSSLTVEVTEQDVVWHFGPGLWRHRLARSEIEAAKIVRNSWRSGFGIRMRPGFRLYNVSGLDAVELRLKSGDVRRIGTDDPRGLAAALNS